MIVTFFLFIFTATTQICALSLHDALPICCSPTSCRRSRRWSRRTRPSSSRCAPPSPRSGRRSGSPRRSEEHTSELQSQSNLVCRLLLEKKKVFLIQSSQNRDTMPFHLKID